MTHTTSHPETISAPPAFALDSATWPAFGEVAEEVGRLLGSLGAIQLRAGANELSSHEWGQVEGQLATTLGAMVFFAAHNGVSGPELEKLVTPDADELTARETVAQAVHRLGMLVAMLGTILRYDGGRDDGHGNDFVEPLKVALANGVDSIYKMVGSMRLDGDRFEERFQQHLQNLHSVAGGAWIQRLLQDARASRPTIGQQIAAECGLTAVEARRLGLS